MATNDRLNRHLANLPEPPLPDALFGRIEGARRQRVQRRRWGLGVAASAALAVALLPSLRPMTSDAPPTIADATVEATAPSVDAERLAQLRALDRDLQNAYDRGATREAEVLWAAREALLAARRGDAPQPTHAIRI